MERSSFDLEMASLLPDTWPLMKPKDGGFLVTWISGVAVMVVFICWMDFLFFVKRGEGAFKN